MDCHLLLQGIFPTQGLSPGLLRCRQTLHRWSHNDNNNRILKRSYTLPLKKSKYYLPQIEGGC